MNAEFTRLIGLGFKLENIEISIDFNGVRNNAKPMFQKNFLPPDGYRERGGQGEVFLENVSDQIIKQVRNNLEIFEMFHVKQHSF